MFFERGDGRLDTRFNRVSGSEATWEHVVDAATKLDTRERRPPAYVRGTISEPA